MHLQRHILTGFFTAIPIIVTYVILTFIFKLLAEAGTPLVHLMTNQIATLSPSIANFFLNPIVQSVLGIILVVAVLYVLGLIATLVIGRRVIKVFEDFFHKVPFVQTVYGATRKLVDAFRPNEEEEDNRRVVLIEFPTPEMKTIGLVTRTMTDQDTGQELAAVYVPTTPNPTSGYLEIVPMERLVMTDWELDEAMSFIMSGGAVAPDHISYSKSVPRKDKTTRLAEQAKPGM